MLSRYGSRRKNSYYVHSRACNRIPRVSPVSFKIALSGLGREIPVTSPSKLNLAFTGLVHGILL